MSDWLKISLELGQTDLNFIYDYYIITRRIDLLYFLTELEESYEGIFAVVILL